MTQHEMDNETTATIDAPPPAAAKPEKARKPRARKVAKDAAAALAAEVEAALPPDPRGDAGGEPTGAIAARSGNGEIFVQSDVEANGNGPAPASSRDAEPQPPRRQQTTQAAETLDIRVLKEMKLPDLTRLAKQHGTANPTAMPTHDLISSV